jgi:hypothetical protein
MYEIKRLAQDVPLKVLNQFGDSVGVDPCLCRRPEAAGKRGKDGFVDDPLLGGVIGIIINRDQVIEGFDQFSPLWRS